MLEKLDYSKMTNQELSMHLAKKCDHRRALVKEAEELSDEILEIKQYLGGRK